MEGRVLGQGNRAQLAGVHASLPGLGLSASTDSAGKFRLAGLPSGEHVLVLRLWAFSPETAYVNVDGDAVLVREFMLRELVTSLPARRVEGTNSTDLRGRLAEFEERRRLGAGHFIDEAMLLRYERRQPEFGQLRRDAHRDSLGIMIQR